VNEEEENVIHGLVFLNKICHLPFPINIGTLKEGNKKSSHRFRNKGFIITDMLILPLYPPPKGETKNLSIFNL
jgi:hypothetical protein